MEELWRTSLVTIREQLTYAVRDASVACVLVQVGPSQYGTNRIKQCPRPIDPKRLVNGGFDEYIRAQSPDAYTWRRTYYVGEKRDTYRYWSLAQDAGRVLRHQSSPAFDGLAEATLACRQDRSRWLYTVFDLAWQRRPGSPLHAEKKIWAPEHFGGTSFPYDQGQFQAITTRLGMRHPVLMEWAEQLPDYFFSELPDVFDASVHAIDLLLFSPAVRDPLSNGELKVWTALAGAAMTGKELARLLDTSSQTIKEHVKHLRAKGYGVGNQPGRGYYRLDRPPSDVASR